MAVEVAVALFASVALYAYSNKNTTAETTKMLAAWANLGNSVVHGLVIAYLLGNDTTDEAAPNFAFWERERALEMDGIGGPVFILLVNSTVGMMALQQKTWWKHHETAGLVWNSFAGVAGIALPSVWPRFLDQGLGGWPYPIVFLWFMILMMESVGLFASWAYYFMKKNDSKTGKQD
jgi:FtsH-binding integral membrane protein